jgi:hypothetical protein
VNSSDDGGEEGQGDFFSCSSDEDLDWSAARIKVATEVHEQREVLRRGREAQVEQYKDAMEARETERAVVVLKGLPTSLPLQAETDGLRTHLCLAAAEADLAAQNDHEQQRIPRHYHTQAIAAMDAIRLRMVRLTKSYI